MKKQLLVALFTSLAFASLQAKTYATIDGKPAVTDKDFELIKKMQPNFDYSKLSDQEKEGLIQEFVTRQLILKAAKQEKLENSSEYITTLNGIKDELLVNLWQKKQADNIQMPAPTEAQLKQIYQQNEGSFINQEGRARHILVKTEAEAKSIISDLDKAKGKAESKFIELANAKTMDPASKQAQNGGDLGNFQRAAMYPEFSNAAFNLKPGTYTKEPVRTPAGYHVIYLISKSEPKTIPYNEAKKIIADQIKMQNIQGGIMQKLQSLREKSTIKITK